MFSPVTACIGQFARIPFVDSFRTGVSFYNSGFTGFHRVCSAASFDSRTVNQRIHLQDLRSCYSIYWSCCPCFPSSLSSRIVFGSFFGYLVLPQHALGILPVFHSLILFGQVFGQVETRWNWEFCPYSICGFFSDKCSDKWKHDGAKGASLGNYLAVPVISQMVCSLITICLKFCCRGAADGRPYFCA
jgi:hypothetical protein